MQIRSASSRLAQSFGSRNGCRLIVELAAIACMLQAIHPSMVTAQTTVSASNGANFSTLLTSETRQTFDEIRRYVADHPEAADRAPAAYWILETSREQGWEADTEEAVTVVLAQSTNDQESQRLALSTRALGAARRKDAAASQAAFKEFLRSLRLRQPNQAADLAQSLALVWQLQGDTAAAEAVYEQLLNGFFLNDELRQFADARRQRLKLVGEPVPAIPQPDLNGNSISWQAWAGKVVIVDFWATNCRPCLEEFPRLKRRYAELSPLGVELLGITFDDDAGFVEQFLTQQPLPWRQVLARETAEAAFHVHLLPCLMLVSPAGRIAAVDIRPDDLHWAVRQELDKIGQEKPGN